MLISRIKEETFKRVYFITTPFQLKVYFFYLKKTIFEKSIKDFPIFLSFIIVLNEFFSHAH
jgi:hypothetical protein